MQKVLEFVIDTLKNDPELQEYLKDGTNPTRVFPQGVDISPEELPMITIFNVSEITKTVPFGEREGVLQVDIWVNEGNLTESPQLIIEKINERVLTLLNFAQYQSGYSSTLLRWSREDASIDAFEPDRRIWHKATRWRWWAKS
jgi:hypothetical protein